MHPTEHYTFVVERSVIGALALKPLVIGELKLSRDTWEGLRFGPSHREDPVDDKVLSWTTMMLKSKTSLFSNHAFGLSWAAMNTKDGRFIFRFRVGFFTKPNFSEIDSANVGI